MKILVCISNVPDTTTKINFSDDKKSFVSTGVQFIINPYDEIALTRALELTEAQVYSDDENFVFINAWNEWAEGNHLEPDMKWGRGYLEKTKEVLKKYI